jgi:hypothetical protein
MLSIRILGMQKEPSGLMKGHEIHDFQYRTRDAEAFEKGKELVEKFVAELDFVPSDSEYYVIDDPMQITLGEYEDTGKFPGMNALVLQLEKLGFFAKSIDYRTAEFNPEFARAFNNAVSSPENIEEDGSINWNFVDADLYGSDHRPNSDDEYYKLYDSLAIQYDLANGVIA